MGTGWVQRGHAETNKQTIQAPNNLYMGTLRASLEVKERHMEPLGALPKGKNRNSLGYCEVEPEHTHTHTFVHAHTYRPSSMLESYSTTECHRLCRQTTQMKGLLGKQRSASAQNPQHFCVCALKEKEKKQAKTILQKKMRHQVPFHLK